MIGRCRVCQRGVLEEESPIFWRGSKYHEACFYSYLSREIDRLERREKHGQLTTVELEELEDLKGLLDKAACGSSRRRSAAWSVRF